MRTSHWRVEVIDGGNFSKYVREVTVNGQSGTMLAESQEFVRDLPLNCIHSITITHIQERTRDDSVQVTYRKKDSVMLDYREITEVLKRK